MYFKFSRKNIYFLLNRLNISDIDNKMTFTFLNTNLLTVYLGHVNVEKMESNYLYGVSRVGSLLMFLLKKSILYLK